jgi:hypothetical protein
MADKQLVAICTSTRGGGFIQYIIAVLGRWLGRKGIDSRKIYITLFFNENKILTRKSSGDR